MTCVNGSHHSSFVPKTNGISKCSSMGNSVAKDLSFYDENPTILLEKMAEENGFKLCEESFASYLDTKDPLKEMRNQFSIPLNKSIPTVDLNLVNGEKSSLYFCGNSLGLKPKKTDEIMKRELKKWALMGVHGHTSGELGWALADELLRERMANIVGAKPKEVAIMNSLSINLHLLLISFYRPSGKKCKILVESKAFPSDYYICESQIRMHGFDPEKALVCLKPREGEVNLRTTDITSYINLHAGEIALILLPGVQYYTGQYLDVKSITKAAHDNSIFIGWDMAHAAGNIPLKLHEWNVDFASWCTYKYLNSGPGGVGAAFLHENHFDNPLTEKRLLGWWGHKSDTRFTMDNSYVPAEGIDAYRVSNPSGFLTAMLQPSLEIFTDTGMVNIRKKSFLLTAYFEMLLQDTANANLSGFNPRILTPTDPLQRGAQLSLDFGEDVHKIFAILQTYGVTADKRLPSVIRLAPCPLYNSFMDVFKLCRIIRNLCQVHHPKVNFSTREKTFH